MKVKDTILEIQETNEFLEAKVKELEEEVTRLKSRNYSYLKMNIRLRNELQDIKKMSMFEFGNTFCSEESLEADGKAFARSLGVGK